MCFVGLAVLAAGVAEELGVSDAIGAFMIGLVLAERRCRTASSGWCCPCAMRFAAVFFFVFGLTIDPERRGQGDRAGAARRRPLPGAEHVAGLIAARMSGFGRGPAANIGLTILGRGEFSLILATLAVEAGLDRADRPVRRASTC